MLVKDIPENYQDFNSSHFDNATYWLGVIYKDNREVLEGYLWQLVDLLIAADIYRKLLSTEKCTSNDVANTMKKVLDKHTEPVKITPPLDSKPWYIKGRW